MATTTDGSGGDEGPTSKPRSVAEIMRELERAGGLNANRRRDLISALKRLCEMLGRDPAAVPADPVALREAIATISPARFEIKVQTWSNVKANIGAALRQVGITGKQARDVPLSPAWRALVRALPSKRLQNALSRLVHFANAEGLAPDQVDDAFFARFMAHVGATTLKTKPTDLHRIAARCWNEAVDHVAGWPQQKLTVPSFRAPRRSRPLADFPVSFQQEVEQHLHWLSGKDLFSKRPLPHRCRPSTVDQRRRQIELAASALVNRGMPIERIMGLAVLVEVENAKDILRTYVGNDLDNISAFTHGLAKMLISIARRWVLVTPEDLDQLRGLKRQLGPERTGLTEKNRATLREVSDPRIAERLEELPRRLMAIATKVPAGDRRAAVQAQLAVAIEIVRKTAMRAANLAHLRLDRHILRPGGRQGHVYIALGPDEVKNGEAMEFVLFPDSVALLDRYLKDFYPLLGGTDCPWLFPSGTGRLKSQATLSQQIEEAIWKHVGIRITLHQFRHIAGMIVLDEEPGNFELVRQLLGHKNSRTTTNFYTGLQTAKAARHYDELLARRRERRRRPDRPPRRPKPDER